MSSTTLVQTRILDDFDSFSREQYIVRKINKFFKRERKKQTNMNNKHEQQKINKHE